MKAKIDLEKITKLSIAFTDAAEGHECADILAALAATVAAIEKVTGLEPWIFDVAIEHRRRGGGYSDSVQMPLEAPHSHRTPNCMTVAELKQMVRYWPEVDTIGQPTQVWISTGEMLSSQCVGLQSLNYRIHHSGPLEGKPTADILFEPRNYTEDL